MNDLAAASAIADSALNRKAFETVLTEPWCMLRFVVFERRAIREVVANLEGDRVTFQAYDLCRGRPAFTDFCAVSLDQPVDSFASDGGVFKGRLDRVSKTHLLSPASVCS